MTAEYYYVTKCGAGINFIMNTCSAGEVQLYAIESEGLFTLVTVKL